MGMLGAVLLGGEAGRTSEVVETPTGGKKGQEQKKDREALHGSLRRDVDAAVGADGPEQQVARGKVHNPDPVAFAAP